LGDAFAHLVLGLVEGGRGLRETMLGLSDDLLGADDSGVCVSQFPGCLVALGNDRGQLTAWGCTIAICGIA
jgi:hypothetical protein